MRPPVGFGEVTGWAGASFLFGIAAHALVPERSISMLALSVVSIAAIFLVLAPSPIAWRRIAGICVLALVIGVWRYDVNRATQPRGLVPFSPRGLAFVSASVRVSERSNPRYWLGRARTELTRRAHERFAPDQAALLTGVLYGEREFSRQDKEAFRRAGLLHLIAVSGSNVTILAVLTMRFLLALRLARRQAFAALTVLLIVFVLFVAPSASVVRAAIMGWLLEFAPVVGRLPRPSRLLLIAAVAFSAWKPWALLYDPGFALSFLAMWGLLTYTPWLDEKLEQRIPWSGLRSILTATLGATLLTLPYAAWAFGQATLIGVVTNLLVLPVIPFVMATGVLSLFVVPGSWFALPAQGFLDWVLGVARTAVHLPIGAWSTRGLSASVMVSAYAVLLLIWLLYRNGDNGYPQNSVRGGSRVERS